MDAPLVERLSLQLGWWLAFGVPLAFVLRGSARLLTRGDLSLRRAFELALVVQVTFAVSMSLGFHANDACRALAFWSAVRWPAFADALQGLSVLHLLPSLLGVWAAYVLVEAWLRRRSGLRLVRDDAVTLTSIGMVGMAAGFPVALAIDLALGSPTLAPQAVWFLWV